MTGEVENLEVSDLAEDLDTALTALQSSLAGASRSVAAIRRHISQVGILVDMVREMEAAMALARQNLSTGSSARSQTARPALQVLPPREATEESQEAASTSGPTAPPSPGRRRATTTPSGPPT